MTRCPNRTRIAGLSFVVVLCCITSSAWALPADRQYEMVSPPYKAGFGVGQIEAAASDGQSVAYLSLGVFAGDPSDNLLTNDYLARRGESEWESSPLSPPASVWPYAAIKDFTPDLKASLTYAMRGQNRAIDIEGKKSEFLIHDTTTTDTESNFGVLGTALTPLHENNEIFLAYYDTSSNDLLHVVFEMSPNEELLPEAEGSQSRIYDISSSGLKLIAVNNKTKPLTLLCKVVTPGEQAGRASWLNAVSADGNEIFFVSGVATNDINSCLPHEQVFVRLGGSRTIEVSRPLDVSKKFGGCVGEFVKIAGEVPCTGATSRGRAEYQGASEDGSRVFFTTEEQLAPTDIDTSNDLYLARIECAGGGLSSCEPEAREVTSLTQISLGSHPSDVQGVVAIAQDGSRVYFVAHGILSGPNTEGHTPLEGADNLYVYEAAKGESAFVADLCSGDGHSGEVSDASCPPSSSAADSLLWTTNLREAEENECGSGPPSCVLGRYLLFSTYARLSRDDTDVAQDLYRYDAATGQIERISLGEHGYDANGNNDLYPASISANDERGSVASQHHLATRAMTDDGSRIVFLTREPLSPSAANGLPNLYLWSESHNGVGEVALISTGSSDQAVEDPVISSVGNDIFFLTTQGLVSQDTDGQRDVYDARLGGGFRQPLAPIEGCAGDACQGPLSNPAPFVAPSTSTQAPGDNTKPPGATKAKKKHIKRRARKGRRRKPGKRSARKAHK